MPEPKVKKPQRCYNLARSVEEIDCALADLKKTVLPRQRMRGFNGVTMSLYSAKGAVKSVIAAVPAVAKDGRKLISRFKVLDKIIRDVGTAPVPEVIAEFIREDLGPLWQHQRILEEAASNHCGAFGMGPLEWEDDKFAPVPKEVTQETARLRKVQEKEAKKHEREMRKMFRTPRRKARRKKTKRARRKKR